MLLNTEKKFDNESGQTLIIIFLVMVLALSIGIAVSSRFIRTTRIITGSDDSARALAIAESAIEHILLLPISTLEDYAANGTCGTDCYLSITGAEGQEMTANVELTTLGNSSDPYVIELNTDEVTQVSLAGYTPNTPVYVCWNNDMSVSALYIKGTQGAYEADSFAYNSSTSPYTDNGFDASVSALGYGSCFFITSDLDSVFLRLKSYYEEGTAVVVPDTGAYLPNQGILITSVGQAGDATKTVTVIITDPVLPSQFDYVLYQKSTTEPLSN